MDKVVEVYCLSLSKKKESILTTFFKKPAFTNHRAKDDPATSVLLLDISMDFFIK